MLTNLMMIPQIADPEIPLGPQRSLCCACLNEIYLFIMTSNITQRRKYVEEQKEK